jgi:hypothetical protein
MVNAIFLLGLGALTSAGAYLIGRRRLGLSRNTVVTAITKLLECVGMALVFFGLNLAVGMVGILAGRLLTRGFVSLYLANDVVLLVLSLLQGVTFQWWREV